LTEVEKVEKKQKASPRSKVNMLALWAAVLTSLGTQGIPELIRLVGNQPSFEQVQKMIADQTSVLTQEQNRLVDAVKDVAKKGSVLEGRLNKLAGEIEGLLRLCCAPPRLAPIRAGNEKPTVEPEAKPAPPPASPDSVLKLEKAPAFDASQVGS